jgi:membrane protease YdiL (CAAX protease family)
VLDGYPLRNYTWKDWLFMALSSNLVVQLLTIIVLSYFMGWFVTSITTETVLQVSAYGTIIGTILSLPLTLLVVRWLKIPLFNRRQLSKKDSFILRGLTTDDWKFLAWYMPVSFILYTIGLQIVAYFFGVSEAANQVAIEGLFNYVPLWVMFIMIVIVAPIVEELLFRGMFLFPGNRLEPTWVRTIISAVLFGMIHGPTDIFTGYSYIGMGFIFAYASKRTKTVEAAMVYHALYNFLGFLQIVVLVQ